MTSRLATVSILGGIVGMIASHSYAYQSAKCVAVVQDQGSTITSGVTYSTVGSGGNKAPGRYADFDSQILFNCTGGKNGSICSVCDSSVLAQLNVFPPPSFNPVQLSSQTMGCGTANAFIVHTSMGPLQAGQNYVVKNYSGPTNASGSCPASPGSDPSQNLYSTIDLNP